jgi:hypothetical protein
MPKVIITASQKVRYRETHEISERLWQRYQEMCDANAKDREFTYYFEHLLDGTNPDSDDITDLQMELVEPVSDDHQ